MAKRQSIDDVMKAAISIWRKEGLDPTDNHTALYNLQNDPVTRMLLAAVTHQSNLISEEIDDFRDSVTNSCVDLCSPAYISQPVPSIAMLQTAKRNILGEKNEAPTILDASVSFQYDKDDGTKRSRLSFMPLLSITVMDVSVRSVQKSACGRWHIEIEARENVDNIGGLGIYIPKMVKSSASFAGIHDRDASYDCSIRLYSGNSPLPVCNVSDYDCLPFVTPFLKGLSYSKNALQCATLQNIHDTLCCYIGNYCVVGYGSNPPLSYKDGCIVLDMEINTADDEFDLSENDIFLNAVPVINVDIHSMSLSQNSPMCKVDVEDGEFLTLVSAEDEDPYDVVSVRQVGTERLTPALWTQKLKSLLETYEHNYSMMDHLLDSKTENNLQQLISSLKQAVVKEPSQYSGTYFVLKDRILPSYDALWLSTSGTLANNIPAGSAMSASSIELDSSDSNSKKLDPSKTKLLTDTIGGQNSIKDKEVQHQYMRYYQMSRDRIISKSDIVVFCRHKLIHSFNLKKSDIHDIRISNIVRNSADGFFERQILVEISIRKGILNPLQTAIALERMIKSRTASSTPIRIAINEI